MGSQLAQDLENQKTFDSSTFRNAVRCQGPNLTTSIRHAWLSSPNLRLCELFPNRQASRCARLQRALCGGSHVRGTDGGVGGQTPPVKNTPSMYILKPSNLTVGRGFQIEPHHLFKALDESWDYGTLPMLKLYPPEASGNNYLKQCLNQRLGGKTLCFDKDSVSQLRLHACSHTFHP